MVRTAYLDQAFEGLEIIPDQIDLLEARVVRREARLERWASRKQTDRRLAKIEKQNLKLDADRQLIAAKNDLLTAYELVDFPQDEFFVTPTKDLVQGIGGYRVDVVDSPYDDSFTGGDRLKMRASYTGRQTQNGTSHYFSTRTLANGDYWPEGQYTTELITGSSMVNPAFDSYPNLNVTIFLDQGNEDVLHTQAFDLTTYFA